MTTEKHPALTFLKHLYALLPGALVELRAIPNAKSSGSKPVRTFITKGNELTEFVDKFGARGTKYGVYFGVSKRQTKGGKKTDVLAAPALWADIDTVKDGLDTSTVAQTIFKLPDQIRPSACVMSGGGLHLYWFLDEPSCEEEAVEQGNRTLQTVFAGDNVADITRILRVPGSYNTKRGAGVKCEVLWLQHWRRFDLYDLIRVAQEWPVVLDGAKMEKRAKVAKKEAEAYYDPLAPYVEALTDGKRNLTRNLDRLWRDRVRHSAPRGYIGIHEAKLVTTARLHCAGVPEKGIMTAINMYLKERVAIDCPELDWDWKAEDEDTLRMIRTWQPKWDELRKEHRREKAKQKNGSGTKIREHV
jgi:hypothetical protein